jgi:hypothetical protein
MVISLTAVKFKLRIFSLFGFALCYAANVFIHMILYDFCLLPAQFSYVIIYIPKVENCVHFGKFPVVQSESELLYDWWLTTNQFILATSLLRLNDQHFFN